LYKCRYGIEQKSAAIFSETLDHDWGSDAVLLHENRSGSPQLWVDADEMLATPFKPKPCDHQVLDAILGAIEQHRSAVATVKTRKLEQRRLAWRLWDIEYDETIPIVAPEEPDWAIMAADIKAAEQEKRELTAVVERVAALLTYFTHSVDTTGSSPIFCGRDRQTLHRWKRHAGHPL
jgi:hypothetical protein